MKKLYFVIKFNFLLSLSFAQLPPTNFYKVTNAEGLSQATVNVLYKDKEGFLWIGTDDGLNRFDGKIIKKYYIFRTSIQFIIDFNAIIVEVRKNLEP